MTLNALSDYVLTAKYAGWNQEASRRETWDEMVDRVHNMHKINYADKGVDSLIDEAMTAVRDRKVLGSQRALQFGGEPILRKHARLYNCTVSYCDRPRFFQEALWLLLCGCGAGFSVQKHHVAKLPELVAPSSETATYTIPDSIEGWADALGVLLSSYFVQNQPFPEYFGKTVKFDYSQIRAAGSKLSSGCGKAPGAKPLERSIELIRQLVESRLTTNDQSCRLRSIDAYDIAMHASDAVISGGVRRSATICLFSPDDKEMASAKTGNWFETNPQRARSNNSVVLLRGATTKEQFNDLFEHVRQFGEPGFIWTDSTELVVNPCAEIGMWPVDVETGETGWSFCNLCEINMKICTDKEKFAESARAAAVLGTLQAGYTSFPYLGEVTERIVRREALLGVSMTGMMDTPDVSFDPELQREMAQLILDVNEEVAAKIGVNPAARATCVKPAGTTSCVLGTASGIHPHHSRRYFRRAQANRMEPPAQLFAQRNPRAAENSVWNPNGTDLSLIFCVEIPEDARTKNDVSAVDLLSHVKSTQENWVMGGRREDSCTKPWLMHNVSNTVTVCDNEWQQVADYLYDNRQAFTGVSLLPDGGDLDYPQAPFCAVLTAEEVLEEYGTGSLFASGLIVDGLHAFNDLWEACAYVLGQRSELPHPMPQDDLENYRSNVDRYLLQRDWIRRAHKFARNYFGGEVLRMTRCLKRVHNAKLWEDLHREYKSVDYRSMVEERIENDQRSQAGAACAGGKCDII